MTAQRKGQKSLFASAGILESLKAGYRPANPASSASLGDAALTLIRLAIDCGRQLPAAFLFWRSSACQS